jgi:hypothetical protein
VVFELVYGKPRRTRTNNTGEIMTTQKTTWAKMCEGAARLFMKRSAGPEAGATTAPPERPLPDVEANDRVLENLSETDPVYRALMDHAFNVFENNNASSMELGHTAEVRLAFSNRAAGVLEFVNQVESTRTRLKAELVRKAKRAEKK